MNLHPPLPLLLFLASLAPAAEIQLHPRCRPSGAVVTLGDVAKLTADDQAHAEALAKIELFPAPPAGRQRILRARELRDLLDARQVNLAEHRISGASETIISSDQEPERPTPERPVKRMERQATSDEGPAAASVVVAAAALPKGAVIRASDVRLEPSASPEAQPAGFQAIDDVVGKETARAVSAGAVLQAQSVRSPLLVRRGEVITVHARSAGIRIRATARAQDEGGLGDPITVESMLNRKKFTARVCGPQEAEVDLPRPSQRPAAE